MFRLPNASRLGRADSNIVDSFDRAKLGYYEFDEDGMLVVEIYAYSAGKARFVYMPVRVSIEGDTIWVYGTPRRRKGSSLDGKRVDLGYKFVKIDGISASPDW